MKHLSDKAKAAGFSIERKPVREAYARNGNAGKPTITYSYTVTLNGKPHCNPLAKHSDAVQFAEDCVSGAL